MIYHFDLRTVGVVVGAAMVILHILSLLHAVDVKKWLTAFPRSKAIGMVLVVISAVWAFWLMATMDLGEFSNFRRPILILIPVATWLTIQYVDEFLSVRALGILLLLLSDPVLEAAFLRPEGSRRILVVLAYVWIVLGMFWLGMPYLMRDQIAWVTRSKSRWTAACVAGALYGFAILACTFLFFKQS